MFDVSRFAPLALGVLLMVAIVWLGAAGPEPDPTVSTVSASAAPVTLFPTELPPLPLISAPPRRQISGAKFITLDTAAPPRRAGTGDIVMLHPPAAH